MCQSNETTGSNLKIQKINSLKIVEKHQHASDVIEIVLEASTELKRQVKACQFFNLGIKQQTGPILKRPISVSQVSDSGIHFIIKELGEGTKRLTQLSIGDDVMAVGPLGNGVIEEDWQNIDEILLIGGGIGTAPLLELAKLANEKGVKVNTILGFLEEPYLEEAFSLVSKQVTTCTINKPSNNNCPPPQNDKITRIQGMVTDGLAQWRVQNDGEHRTVLAVACGPDKMLKAIKDQLHGTQIKLLVVTEERMACGMGACLVCAKKVVQDDEVKMLRTCIEGPVFKGAEVVFE